MLGLPQQVWIHSSTSSRPSTSWLNASTMKSSSSVSSGWKAAVKWIVGSSIWITFAPGGRELAQLGVHGRRHVPDELLLVVEVVLGRVAVEEDRQHLRGAGPELDRLARRGPARSATASRTRAGSSGRARPCRRRAASARSSRSRSSACPARTRAASRATARTGAPRARGPSSAGAGSGATSGRRSPRRGGSRRWSGCRGRPASGRRGPSAWASRNCSRNRTSRSAVSSGRPHSPWSYQRGRGHEPVTVAGSMRSLVAVSIARAPPRRDPVG